MKLPQIFALTKREQRVVIAIVLALLAGTIAMHYRGLRSDISPPAAIPAATPDAP
jgi:hypothetical protein